jgi:hypothetical protein
MSAPRTWSDADNAELLRLATAGVSWVEIGQRFDRNAEACRVQWCRLRKGRGDRPRGPRSGRTAPWPADQLRRAVEMRQAGAEWAAIGRAIGRPPKAVAQRLYRHQKESARCAT